MLIVCSPDSRFGRNDISGSSRGISSQPDRNLTNKSSALEGISSYYGYKFHGKLTASGEKFDMHQLTAAHKTLPFNTLIRVTNLDNGKSVIVKINDRGPFVKNRILDLSYGAAQKIDMINSGTARVRIEIIKDASTLPND
jgi:rare lipoprotein A